VTPAGFAHELSRWGPFVLIALWGLAVAWARRRKANAGPGPDVPAKARRAFRKRRALVPGLAAPPPALFAETVTAPRPAVLAAASTPTIAPTAPPSAPVLPVERIAFQLPERLPELEPDQPMALLAGVPLAQAVVLTEVLGLPVALRRPGTLPAPLAF
jgi:hypothetical protein